ncbi:MAG: ATP-binding protein [Verrucomicrobiota bacterium]
MGWIKANADYLVFVGLWVGLFAIKNWWLVRTGRRYAISRSEWLFTLLIFIGGWILLDYSTIQEHSQIRDMISSMAPTYAQELERMGHAKITPNTPPDDPLYLSMIQAEIRWQKANPKVADIYTVRKLPNGRNVMIIDSETDYNHNGLYEGEREQRTPIGEVYPEKDEAMERAFRGAITFDNVPITDRWGTWVSCFVPMKGASGRTEAVLGVDFDANLWLQAIRLTRLVAMIILSSLLVIVAAFNVMISTARARLRERDLADEALRSSQQKLLFHVKRTPLAVIEMNRNSEITEWNAAAEQTFGFTREEALGRNVIDLIVPEKTRMHVKQVVFDLMNQQGGTRSKNENITKDGRTIQCEWFNTPLIDNNGMPIGSISLCQDVTERERAAAAIENLAAFPRLNPNPVLQFSSAGNLIYFNDAAQQMAKSLGGENICDLLPENTHGIVHDCITTGEKAKCETKVGDRIISWSFFPIAEIDSVHCYAGEITERLNLESQLRQSQKMQSVGHLAAGVAHDFNNILVVIQGHSELLLLREKLSPAGAESLHQISTAAERAARLTQQLLAFGRKQPMQKQPINFNEVIHRVTQMLQRVLGAHITLRTSYSPNLPVIMGDPTMMEQIVMNLSVNARDAMPNGGSLIIGTAPVRVTRAHVDRNPDSREGFFVCLNVSDNGTGIDPDKIDKLFEPFFTTKEKGKGTGLGLATVYGIVTQHKGWIEVESTLGKGTTFKVYLPASETQTIATSGPAAPARIVAGGKETILLVEDEIGVLTLSRNILKTYGYHVLEARSGGEALRVWEEHPGAIDMLFADIVLPEGMSGIELADKLTLEKHELAVLFTSGYSIDVLVQDFGFDENKPFVKKPSPPHLLAEKVRACLDRKT